MKKGMEAAKKSMLARYPFFGSLAASVEYVETTRVRTMGSNGRTIYYNPAYVEGLTEEERTFLLTHEICHIAGDHIRRGQGKDPVVWQEATDAVINQLLKRDGMKIIQGGIDYPEAIDYDADAYYDLLLAQKLDIELSEGMLEGTETVSDEETEREEGDQIIPADEVMDDDHSLWDEEELEEIEIFTPRDGKQAGTAIGRDERPIAQIGHGKPILDWRLILRDTINYGVDWSLIHPQIEDGIVRPVLETWPMPETEIVLDTSSSVDDNLLRNFLRECKNILQFSRLRAGCFDTMFYGFQEIRTEEDIDKMVFMGGGGTDFNVATRAFSLRCDNKIIFTDGCAPMPEEPIDAVWLVYGDEEIDPGLGKVIHITEEQMKKLRLP